MFKNDLENGTNKLLENCEDLIRQSLSLSDVSVIDMVDMVTADDETTKAFRTVIDTYNSAKDLAVSQARTMDKMLYILEELQTDVKVLKREVDGIKDWMVLRSKND